MIEYLKAIQAEAKLGDPSQPPVAKEGGAGSGLAVPEVAAPLSEGNGSGAPALA